uniref:F-box/FBD/LRR-repeat protein At1g16930-like n=1 Tax=Fragaria vesca subsp. vesca TaxID=101020 RepID=UPI0005CA95E6|nr:PREDICTED: F-box/FBD/LRR-repeat protein At1g16930-like [Fragaria vesca subsp. vesca]
MASNSKRLKSCSNSKRLKPCSNHEDRISGLPDEILCHILSFLFTREAVKTSVLSHRWTNVWTSVPILDLDEEEFHIDFKRRALPKGSQLIRHVPDWFAQYVNRVLLFRCPGDIQRFRLVVGRMDDVSRIYAWIATAIRRNVVELDLAVGITRKPNFEIPKRLFMCSTLVRLKLWLHRYTRVMTPTSSNCFPSLKFFHVAVLNPGSDSMVKLFSRCLPVLEELIIDGKLDTTAFNPNISAPKLKRLQIKLAVHKVNMIAAADHYVYYVCRTFINVDAPNLEEFDICFDAMVSFSLKNVKRLRKAKIDFFKEIMDHDCFPGLADRIHQICAGICDAKYLTVKAPIFAVSMLLFSWWLIAFIVYVLEFPHRILAI